ncbi:MAG: hypothetical protein K2K97_01605, partial [Muribaculaceae bacterium]|nr:hypothetical protein [Muribaculaceae bacterium]
PYDLSQLEALPELDTDQLIPSFPEQKKSPLPTKGSAEESAENESPKVTANQKADSPSEAPEEPSLSESLAKIMIKNGNYQKALEIITEISLNNPKKSVYFADQIRFLKKLIKYTAVSD